MELYFLKWTVKEILYFKKKANILLNNYKKKVWDKEFIIKMKELKDILDKKITL